MNDNQTQTKECEFDIFPQADIGRMYPAEFLASLATTGQDALKKCVRDVFGKLRSLDQAAESDQVRQLEQQLVSLVDAVCFVTQVAATRYERELTDTEADFMASSVPELARLASDTGGAFYSPGGATCPRKDTAWRRYMGDAPAAGQKKAEAQVLRELGY